MIRDCRRTHAAVAVRVLFMRLDKVLLHDAKG